MKPFVLQFNAYSLVLLLDKLSLGDTTDIWWPICIIAQAHALKPTSSAPTVEPSSQ